MDIIMSFTYYIGPKYINTSRSYGGVVPFSLNDPSLLFSQTLCLFLISFLSPKDVTHWPAVTVRLVGRKCACLTSSAFPL